MNKLSVSNGARHWLLPGTGVTANLRLYRLAEAEAITGIRVRKLKTLIREGRLTGTRLSKNDLRISAADLENFFQQCKTRTIL